MATAVLQPKVTLIFLALIVRSLQATMLLITHALIELLHKGAGLIHLVRHLREHCVYVIVAPHFTSYHARPKVDEQILIDVSFPNLVDVTIQAPNLVDVSFHNRGVLNGRSIQLNDVGFKTISAAGGGDYKGAN